MAVPIPTEVYVAVLDRSIQIHWNYHALLMTIVWLVLVPAGVFAVPVGADPRTAFFVTSGSMNLSVEIVGWLDRDGIAKGAGPC